MINSYIRANYVDVYPRWTKDRLLCSYCTIPSTTDIYISEVRETHLIVQDSLPIRLNFILLRSIVFYSFKVEKRIHTPSSLRIVRQIHVPLELSPPFGDHNSSN